jgi:hypothetical protein
VSWTPNRKRTRNAEEFLERYRQIRQSYEAGPVPRLAALREMYVGEGEVGESTLLEAHVRHHLVDPTLEALNWPLALNSSPERSDVAVEMPVRSDERGTVRFLDYFGVDRHSERPLLIVETKRPDDPQPELVRRGRRVNGAEAIARGLAGESMRGGWDEWLGTLRDYVRSVFAGAGVPPPRVVITNGVWMAVFLDPASAFLDDGTIDPAQILYCKDRDEVEERAAEIFHHLEHQAVLGDCGELLPGGLGLMIATADVQTLMHAVRVRYSASRGVYRFRPMITVAPSVLLQSRTGAWLYVGGRWEAELPTDPEKLELHRIDVEEQARALLQRVNVALGVDFQPAPVTETSRVASGGENLTGARYSGVREIDPDEYYIITGDHAHFLVADPHTRACPFHQWRESRTQGVASTAAPIDVPSVEDRSFFTTGSEHHCSHTDVHAAKRTPVTPENLLRTGPRGGRIGEAFCLLWSLERHLCCRTCVFQPVCVAAEGFRLPCRGAAESTETSLPAPISDPPLITLSYTPRSEPRGTDSTSSTSEAEQLGMAGCRQAVEGSEGA